MKKNSFILGLISLFISVATYSQVGIGIAQPNTSTMLEIYGTDKGILIPRVALKSLTDATTITKGNVNSLLVYNTNTVTGSVAPGYYYWLTNKWMRLTNDDDLKTIGKNLTSTDLIITNGTGATLTTVSADIKDEAVTSNKIANGTILPIDLANSTGPNQVLVTGTNNAPVWLNQSVLAASSEPWKVQTTTNPATDNTQNIYQTGKVAIGRAVTTALTGADATAALYVNGTITTTNSIYPDYVFEDYMNGFSELKKDYTFKSLPEVEKFISQNKHLPGVTGIKNLNKNENGDFVFNLSELSVQTLEKVEELYLHVIKQQKQIELKNNEVEELKKGNQELLERIQKLENLVDRLKK